MAADKLRLIAVGVMDDERRCGVSRWGVSNSAFVGVSVLLFAGSVAVTLAMGASMASMGGMPMPGGWTMSMTWMRMPGQTWPGVAASFVAMWIVMMLAMMMPSLLPMLARYRRAVDTRRAGHRDLLTALVGMGYLLVWTALGVAIFPLGVAAAAVAMRSPAVSLAVPFIVAVMLVFGGALQFTAWKARQLSCCRKSSVGCSIPADAGTALRHGLRLGWHCSCCCAGLTMVLLVVGVMDVRAMALVGAAITLERLMPAGERMAKIVGAAVAATGLWWFGRAVGIG